MDKFSKKEEDNPTKKEWRNTLKKDIGLLFGIQLIKITFKEEDKISKEKVREVPQKTLDFEH